MINGIKKETIVSTTEDRLTLLNWLKKLEKTLSDDTLTDIAFNDDNGNVSLVLTFEDGTTKSVAFPYDMSEFATKEELLQYPKKSSLPEYTDISDLTCQNENFVLDSARGYAELKNNLLVVNAVIKGTSDSTGQIFFDFTLPEELGSLIKPFVANFAATMSGRVFTSDSGGKVTQVFLIKNNNTSFTLRFNDSSTISSLYSVIINVLLW